MNIVDLAEVMHQHSEHDPVPDLPGSRIAGVKRKVDAVRRRRAVAALAGIVALVAGISLVHTVGAGRPASPAATPTAVKTINGFPEYALGGHLVGTQTASLDRSISLTVVPTDLGWEFSNRCPVVDPSIELEITMTLANGTKVRVSCAPSAGLYSSEDSLLADHIQPGVPTVLTFSAKAYRVTTGANGEQTGRTPIPLPAGTYAIGVFQKLPFDQYPLPPRPKTLPTLDLAPFGLGGGTRPVQTVYSDRTNPLAPRTISFTMPDCGARASGNCNPIAATSQTPGFLHIAVNGIQVNTAEFWDYTGGGSQFNIVPDMTDKLHLHAGELVTVTITPQHVTGAWEFALAPGLQQ